MTQNPFDQVVIDTFPYPIAPLYQQALTSPEPRERVQLSVRVFEYMLRALSLVVISDYLAPRNQHIRSEEFNQLLLEHFPMPATLSTWKQILLVGIEAFADKPEDFFIEELYKLYWDTTQTPHRPRLDVQQQIQELLDERNNLPLDEAAEQADWDQIGQRISLRVHTLLKRLQFISDYNLIVVKDMDASSIYYELRRGPKITLEEHPLSHEILERDNYYVTKDFERYLRLHPLIIPDELIRRSEGMRFYQSFSQTYISYLNVPKDAITQSTAFAPAVRDLYNFSLQQQKASKARLRPNQVTWAALREAVNALNKERGNKAFTEFQDEQKRRLFVTRRTAYEHITRFLQSPEEIFVILGKSGVGKSSLLAQYVHEQANNDQITFLIYDAAYFSSSEETIRGQVAHDLSMKLNIDMSDKAVNEETVFDLLGAWCTSGKKTFVLIVDAINEAFAPARLLQELDQLAVRRYDWLKIIISSRPQSWMDARRLYPHIHTNLYYSPPPAHNIGLEISDFSFEEARDVFERYRAYYEVKTNYDQLSVLTKRVLLDPLTLALICQTHRRKAIKSSVRTSQIYGEYIESLTTSVDEQNTRLRDSDIRFLTTHLMPVFIAGFEDKDIRLAIPLIELGEIKYGGDRLLSEMILGEDVMRDQLPMNQMYLNLADAQILTLRGTAVDKELGFRYERFWEYFGGKRLLQMLQKLPQSEQLERCVQLARLSRRKAYVGGILHSALLDHLVQLGDDDARKRIVIAMTQCDEALEILEETLHVVGQEQSFDLGALLTALSAKPEANVSQVEEITRKRLAINLAAAFDYPDILETLSQDTDQAVRTLALFGVYQYWLHDHNKGYAFIRMLSEKAVTRFGLPNRRYFEATMGASLFIFFREFNKTPGVGDNLLTSWRPLIERLLHVNRSPRNVFSRSYEKVKGVFRRALITLVTKVVVRWASDAPSTTNALNITELNAFYQRDQDWENRRQQTRQVVEFFDLERDISEIEPILKSIAKSYHIFLNWIVSIALDVHLRKSPDKVVDQAIKLFHEAENNEPVGPLYGYGSLWAMAMATRPEFNAQHADYLDRYGDLIASVLTRTDGWFKTATGRVRMLHFTRFSYCESKQMRAPISGRALDYLQKALDNRDYDTLNQLTTQDFNVAGHQDWAIDTALDGIQRLLTFQDSQDRRRSDQLHEMCISSLRRLRLFHQDRIDLFLAQADVDVEVVRAVVSKAPTNRFTDDWSAEGLYFWESAIVRTHSPELWNKVHWLFAQVPECNSFSEWLSLLLRAAVNLVYNGPLFPEIDKAQETFAKAKHQP